MESQPSPFYNWFFNSKTCLFWYDKNKKMWKTVWVDWWLDFPHHLMSVTVLIDTAQHKYIIVCNSWYWLIRERYIAFFFLQRWDFPLLKHCFVEVVKYLRFGVISSHLCRVWLGFFCWKFYLWMMFFILYNYDFQRVFFIM